MSPLTWLRLLAVLIVALVVQSALLNQLVVFGVHPDVMVILPVAGGFVAGPQRGASIGFAAGLLADLLVQLPYGLSSVTFVLAAFTAGIITRSSGAGEMRVGETFSCAILSTATSALYVLLGTIVGQSGMLSDQTPKALAVVGAGALLFSYPVLRALKWGVRGSVAAHSIPSGGSALG